MRICIINGSIREENTTQRVSNAMASAASSLCIESSIVTLHSFATIFTGTYVYSDTSNPDQQQVCSAMKEATTLIFVVPTYYRSMPGILKNFFDLMRSPDVYANKIIAVVSSNHKNQDYGAQHVLSVLQGLLIFFSIRSIIVPEILIQNPALDNEAEISRFLVQLKEYDAMKVSEGSS